MSAELVMRILPDFDHVSVTVMDSGGSVSALAQAGDLATPLDQLQDSSGEGPCLDSLRTAAVVVAPDIRRDARWPRYVPEATALGLSSQVVSPLQWREREPIGALNLYSTTRETIDPAAPVIAAALAAQIASAVISFREIGGLHRALANRKTIGMAVGILMSQYGLAESTAFTLLRRLSTDNNVKLRDVAAQIVADGRMVDLSQAPGHVLPGARLVTYGHVGDGAPHHNLSAPPG